MKAGDRQRGAEIAPGVFFLGWSAEISRTCDAVECPECSGFAKEVDSTAEEISSDLNCGRARACCCAAFVCKKCGKRWVGHREAPEME